MAKVMMARVKASQSQPIMVAFGGRQFVKNELRQVPAGAGEQELEAASAFLEFEEVAVVPSAPGELDLPNMTVKELQALAKDAGLTGFSSMKKAELVDALLEVAEAEPEADEDEELTRSEVINEFGEALGQKLIDLGYTTVTMAMDAAEEGNLDDDLTEEELAELLEG